MQENIDNKVSESVKPINPVIQTEQPKSNNFLVILLSILLIISVAISGFFAFQTQKLVKELTELRTQEKIVVVATTEPVASNSSEVDPTANWKTYTNSKYGYSIKYPQDQKVYRLVCENESDMFYMVLGENKDILEPQNCARDSRFNLEIVASDKPFIFDDRYTYTSQDYVVNKVKATKMVFSQKPNFDGPGESWYTEVRFEKGGYYYDAYIRNKDLSDTLDHILSTFKFLN